VKIIEFLAESCESLNITKIKKKLTNFQQIIIIIILFAQ